MSDYDAIQAHVGSQLTCYEPGTIPAAAKPPYAILHGGVAQVRDRFIDGQTPYRETVHRLIVVSNTQAGARIQADRATTLLDGHVLDAAPITVAYISDPIDDRTDPSGIRWSCTLEVRHHTHK